MDSVNKFNKVIIENLTKNKRFLFKRKSYIPRFAKMGKTFKKQGKIRAQLLKAEGITVPAIMILSITNDCNLNCAGCYACAQNREKEDELTIAEIESVIAEATEIGVAILMIAGGEPLMKKGILDVVEKHDECLFVMFTNGLMINGETLEKLKGIKNIISVVSLEGSKDVTDERRGEGVFDMAMAAINRMDENDMLSGVSITLTSKNYDEVMEREYLHSIQKEGVAATFLIEYVPCQGDEELCLSQEQKADMNKRIDAYSKEFDMLIVPLPGDEDQYGGCLAAGRGFLHISSTGSLEACPFAPYSDANIKHMPLKEALQSKLLKEVRENHHLLREGKGGCTLVANKEWIENLAEGQ
ncbi:MAG: radical SAM protein [Eubacteriales bacterium]